jgi:UDP-N-acetylglucosamine diphosphorylase/glucosamine-1-phosphate N-acetyltransferase
MNILLFDDEKRSDLLPLTYTRPCGDLRVGILTLAQKWENRTKGEVSFITEEYLSPKYPSTFTTDNFYINGRVLATDELRASIEQLAINQSIWHGESLIALRTNESLTTYATLNDHKSRRATIENVPQINFAYDIFHLNGAEIIADYALITSGRQSARPSDSNTLIGDDIFIEEGAILEAATLNSKNGPIYIGKHTEIMEGALVRGPLALCNGSVIKMGAKIYGDTTIGPSCKVGGEVSNTVFYANSNKGHDGYLGNSVIGEWCNLGADTNCSNLKNNYAQVKLWNYTKKRFLHSGLQFCGLIMGDHSKCGINTMFNTGTVIGVSANIFGASFPRNFIPSFAWGGASGFTTYTIPKAMETARIVMLRRKKELDITEKNIMNSVFEHSTEHRYWENKPLNK